MLDSFFTKERARFNPKLILVIFLVGCQASPSVEPNQQGYTRSVEALSNQAEQKEKDKQTETTSVQSVNVKPTIQKRVITQEPGIVPTKLSIPSLELEASVIAVGLQADGSMEVPKNVTKIGWYTPGSKPGQNGNVVLAGHVDSYLGPAVFFNLKKISIDDEIVISDGVETIKYKVIKKESYPVGQGPIEEIFGYTTEKRLHLITCTGYFNPFSRTYDERLVVTAVAE